MSYRTILTVLHEADTAQHLVSASAAMARWFDAHLDVLCVGIDEVQLGYYFAGADAMVQQASLDQARKRAEQTATAAEAAAGREDVRWSSRGIVVQFGALSDVIADAARFADLVVLPAPYGDDRPPEDEAILEAALFGGRSAVLVVPASGLPSGFERRTVVGWNDGSEALAAVRAALPLLQRSETCSIAVIDPPTRGTDQAEPGRALCTMLSRHEVHAEVTLLPRTHSRVADVLLDHARDQQAGLIVTGAYGHSRIRQAIIGGVTHDLLADASLPVLMAH